MGLLQKGLCQGYMETSGDSKYSGRNTELPDGLDSASGPNGGLQVSEEIVGL